MSKIINIKKSIAKGDITPPPSKSMSHRIIIASCLSRGICEVDNILLSKDIEATINICKNLGANIEINNNKLLIDSTNFLINVNNNVLDCYESGSTLRFFIPVCLLNNKKYVFIGSDVLMSRPLDEYKKLCKENDFLFDLNDNKLTIQGELKNGTYHISSSVSSQFATGLMFALSFLEGDSKIIFDGEINSSSYILMTISILKEYGIDIEFINNEITIKNSKFIIKNNIVESDMSNAAFLDAFNYIGGSVNLLNINPNSLQGDKEYKQIFDKLNIGYCEIDIKNIPDLAPIIIALASLKSGCTLIHTNRLKIKESDRGLAMKEELHKCNINIDILDDKIIVNKNDIKKPVVNLLSHNDHRIAMAISVLLSYVGGNLEGYEAVSKSYPNFYEDIKSLGVLFDEV